MKKETGMILSLAAMAAGMVFCWFAFLWALGNSPLLGG